MDGDSLYSIGDLARRTGLTVKTIRFYSDRGIVAPTDRSPAGYRLYDIDAVARLDFVRTLRALGLDLPTVRKVVDRELPLPEVAAAHAEALAVQIRTLRLRRAVWTAVARRGSTPEEMELMHRLAKLSEKEREGLIAEFLDDVFAHLHSDPAFTAVIRTMTPELPDAPEAEQVEAWVELAELSQDPDFRAAVRQMADDQAAERTQGDTAVVRRDLAAVVRDQVGPALAAGVAPASPEAGPVVAALTAHYACISGHGDDSELRRRLLTRLETVNDPRREQYFQLLAVINGWPAPQSLTTVLDWSIQALRARIRRAGP
ncbi:MerR family transcriptional regulator [Streptomyces sp. NBC_01762]|uniref:MerR family transcriptional regulator n=1 Tax=unclassified Streptomyces TaxID=2593676 RepID=UPI002DDA7246|nr:MULTISPECIES: MerR family transcriptional regulator [unclassified Streptomyces]WSC43154.1 MerR family transcriptional regulator [Streptomyces sp. NBC_01762]WSD22691.1 MerR family transcriptional regulator [Streptomyces sp. NBC_01751]WSJ55290.1 MerR family transcriptional regulator [Streptomyces sp. NBC_01318]